MVKTYDIVVIGGGPGGYTAALHAAELGQKTALIEADFLGGTCLNRGCIPSKTYLKHAEIIEQIEKGKEWGIDSGPLQLSLSKMKNRKDDVVKRLRNGIAFLLKKGKVDAYNGYGTVLPDGKVMIQSASKEETIKGNKIIIATGSVPAVPPISGLETVSYETSDTVFDLEEIPKSVVIIGGGVIGVEFATIFAALQAEVSIIEASDKIIPTEDIEASKFLTSSLKKKGITIHTNAKVQRVEETEGTKLVVCEDEKGNEQKLHTDILIVCTGRRPNLSAVSGLPLETNGPFLQVNSQMETSMTNVYAIGDVIGGWQLAHAASAEGIVAVNNASGGKDYIDYKVMPRCIYTLPEIASVGLSEAAAKAQGMDVKIETFNFGGSGKAISAGQPEGFTKIIYEARFGEIIGVVMAGGNVTELIANASAFMYLEGTIEEAASMIHPHPTISETFYEAALNAVYKSKANKEIHSAI
ncbi:dihydrolipoyl dehydrogenase [Niallia sp. FSL R7-0271]|uniref:dihydrolipoyl dehydrogenase n=1 Tax=Niallia sp. FSL R7-0271 TaxID=2921678 RepID=UPI0030F60305